MENQNLPRLSEEKKPAEPAVIEQLSPIQVPPKDIPTASIERDISETKYFEDPFEGIEYFKRFDREAVERIEKGVEGEDGWSMTEFYPRTSDVRILKQETGRLKTWTFNVRLQHGAAPFGPLRDSDKEMIAGELEALRSGGVDLEAPEGFPEIAEAVGEITSGNPVAPEELQEGSFYMALAEFGEWRVFKFKRLEPFDYDSGGAGFVLIGSPSDGLDDSIFLSISSRTHHPYRCVGKKEESEVGQVYTRQSVGHTDGLKEVYKVDQAALETICALRPAAMDPLVGRGISREAFVSGVTMEGLQYERWGADEIGGPRYEKINREAYQKALETLMRRFGSSVFVEELKKTIDRHLQGLHTEQHLDGSPYKPHSDVAPLHADEMTIARQAILDAHPMPGSMGESGFVVNVKSIFGDADFWAILRDAHRDIFDQLVDYIAALPRNLEQRGSYYATAEIDPVALIREQFPDAYREISIVRPDFVSDAISAIRITGRS